VLALGAKTGIGGDPFPGGSSIRGSSRATASQPFTESLVVSRKSQPRSRRRSDSVAIHDGTHFYAPDAFLRAYGVPNQLRSDRVLCPKDHRRPWTTHRTHPIPGQLPWRRSNS
jgi:hypothetical protein